MAGWPILSLTTFLPLVGAASILAIRGDAATVARNARNIALWTTLTTFLLSLLLWAGFDPNVTGYQFEERADWIPAFNISYHMGIDGISLFFVLLTTFVTPLCILASWERVQHRVKEFMIAFLVFEAAMTGIFCALDFLLFYLFYEAVLLPMFIIIGVWGGPQRVPAALRFFLYTMAGSVFMLIALLVFYFNFGTTDIPVLIAQGHTLSSSTQIWLWLALAASFMIKIPVWPVHTWLPDAYAEAPGGAAALLAGVLLKVGGYIFLRFSIPMLPIGSDVLAPLVYALAVIALIYVSGVTVMITLAYGDLKKWVAYATLAHMGFGYIGMFTMTTQVLQGAVIVMLSYGLISVALFCCVGMLEERANTRDIARFSGVVETMPIFAFAMMVFMLASLGVPGTSGFVGEFLVLVGAYQASSWLALFAGTILVLGCIYFLWMYRLVVFEKAELADSSGLKDLNWREVAIVVPLVLVILWIGIYPDSFIHETTATVGDLINHYQTALAEAGSVAVALH